MSSARVQELEKLWAVLQESHSFLYLCSGSEEENRTLSYIADIADRMKDLRINDKGKGIERKEQTALVPYKGDGAIVPFEEFDPVKKRKPRPRVDLDPETNRLWNLLMGKEGSARKHKNGGKTKEKSSEVESTHSLRECI
ncbi:UNVERIFIED_CONTAM: Transcriptional activator DEMETER [Sesamum radiatum]|uniref:Transcriptional activator DEMETER n=1 Tax=Sesamum radiatum TaxID=300843 RepID=A0AAW2KAL6_SESRA